MKTRSLVRAVIAAIALGGIAPASAQEPIVFDHAGLSRQALEKHIRPGYAAVASNAQALAKALDGYCPAQDAQRRRAVDRAFDGLVVAWGGIEHIRFGPVTAENRLERIFFWPDRRGLGARQIAATLRERDPDAIDPAKLAAKRVAIQGIGALEIALFEKSAESEKLEDRTYRCAYAKAIALNLAGLSEAVLQEWSEGGAYAREWLNPGDGNPHFLKATETTLALAKSLDNGLERARDEWIGGPIGFGPQRRPLPAVLNKSGRTLQFILGGIKGLHHLYLVGGMHKAIIDAGRNHPTVTTELNAKLADREMRTGIETIRKLSRGGKPLDVSSMKQPLVAVGFPLKNARDQVAALLALTASVSIGFNASDGD